MTVRKFPRSFLYCIGETAEDVLSFTNIMAEEKKAYDYVIIQEAGLTLNSDKCEFSQDKLVFLGHVIDGRDTSPDPSKTHAVLEMESPTTTTELQKFLVMVNQLGKFSAQLADLSGCAEGQR